MTMIDRRGSTLIELILSMTAGSGVMLLGISLVHQSMLLAEKSSNRADNNRTLDQLSQCFRRDVHVATQWSVDAQGTLTMTCSDDSQVIYTAHSRMVIRERKKGPNEFERERFALAENASAHFEPMNNPVRVSIFVNTASGHGGTESLSSKERLDLMVECIPGKWQTLERSQGDRP